MILPVTLTAAGAAALINIWLAVRCGRTRTSANIMIGDGGNDVLTRRMRAHANFVEYTPFVLILIALVELATGTSTWLWIVASLYLIGRVAHGFGMDGWLPGRMAGTIVTMLTLLGLGLYALTIPYAAPRLPAPVEVLDAG